MKAKDGDGVKVNYTLKIRTDEVVETSVDRGPLVFTLGEKQMIPGFENGILEMEPGETKTLHIPAPEAYGPRDERLVFEFDRSKAPESFDPCIGQRLQMNRPDGQTFAVTVIKRTEKGFMMDANHPLAGEDLTFDLELLEITS